MDVLDTLIAPVIAKYGTRPRVEVFITPHGTKVHAVAGCQNAKRPVSVSSIDLTKVCARCMRRSALGADRADVLADALVVHAAGTVARTLVRHGPSTRSPRGDIGRYLELVDMLTAGPHPVAAALRDMFPGGVAESDIDLAHVGAAASASWAPDAAAQNWARILTGDTSKAQHVWELMLAWLGGGAEPSRAVTLAVTAVRAPAGLTLDMLPVTLSSSRSTHTTTEAWLQYEWETAADAARAGLADMMTACITKSYTSQVMNSPVVAAGSRKWVGRAVSVAARHNHTLMSGHTDAADGLVMCSRLVFEALTVLDKNSDLALTCTSDPVTSIVVASPDVLKIAEILRQDHPIRPWADLISMAAVVAEQI